MDDSPVWQRSGSGRWSGRRLRLERVWYEQARAALSVPASSDPLRLVFLYGPPGVGKLTVARELVALTGLKLFHNHLTVDLVESVFPRGTPSFGRLLRRFRRDVLTEAAQEGVDLAFTFVYAHPDDEPVVREMVEPVEARGGAVHFVQLVCAREVLLGRVAEESRRAYRKLNDARALEGLLGRYDLWTPVPLGDSLVLDTTDLQPADAAARIVAHYGLPPPPPKSASGGVDRREPRLHA